MMRLPQSGRCLLVLLLCCSWSSVYACTASPPPVGSDSDRHTASHTNITGVEGEKDPLQQHLPDVSAPSLLLLAQAWSDAQQHKLLPAAIGSTSQWGRFLQTALALRLYCTGMAQKASEAASFPVATRLAVLKTLEGFRSATNTARSASVSTATAWPALHSALRTATTRVLHAWQQGSIAKRGWAYAMHDAAHNSIAQSCSSKAVLRLADWFRLHATRAAGNVSAPSLLLNQVLLQALGSTYMHLKTVGRSLFLALSVQHQHQQHHYYQQQPGTPALARFAQRSSRATRQLVEQIRASGRLMQQQHLQLIASEVIRSYRRFAGNSTALFNNLGRWWQAFTAHAADSTLMQQLQAALARIRRAWA